MGLKQLGGVVLVLVVGLILFFAFNQLDLAFHNAIEKKHNQAIGEQ